MQELYVSPAAPSLLNDGLIVLIALMVLAAVVASCYLRAKLFPVERSFIDRIVAWVAKP